MIAKRAPFTVTLVAAAIAAACGGGDQKKGSTLPQGGGAAQEGTPAGDQAQAVKLPAIPAQPGARPDAVLATISIGTPQEQFGQLAAYADAVSPGIGAMVGPNLVTMLAGAIGAPGLDGYDLSKPLHLIVLDPEKGGGEALLVVGVADEQRLVGSVGGEAMVQVHEGFAAIGKGPALIAASPYALSNLAKTSPAPYPKAVVYMARIMDSYGERFAQEVRSNVGAGSNPAQQKAAEALVQALRAIDRLEATLEASKDNATASFLVHPVAGSALARWAQVQEAADYSVAARLPKGPWLMLAAGRIDWGALSGFWSDMAAAQGNQELAAYLPHLGPDVALALLAKENKEFRVSGLFSLKEGSGKAVSDLLVAYVKGMAKDPKMMDSMKVTGKPSAYRTGGATLHRLNVQPGPDASAEEKKKFVDTFGKGGLTSYFGVAGDWLVFAMDKDKGARSLAAKTISGAKKKKVTSSQLGKVFDAAVEDSKARKESGLMVFDLAAVAPDPVAAKGAMVTVGLGFEGPVMRTRLSIPPATLRAFIPTAQVAP